MSEPTERATRIYMALRDVIGSDNMTARFSTYTLPVLSEVIDLLQLKSTAYRDSAFERSGILSQVVPAEALLIRADDKIRRIKHGDRNALGEDAMLDLIGYLILYLAVSRAVEDGMEDPV